MIIYGKKISPLVEEEIIKFVQEKKELNNFSETYILKYTEHLLKKNKKLLAALASGEMKSKDFSKFIKDIREKARRIYGVYITKKYGNKKEMKGDDLLRLHLSTKERLPYYPEIYAKLIEMTCKPKSVLDLACGLNPIANHYLGKVKYYASDLSEKDVEFISHFVDKAFRMDLSEESEFSKLLNYKTDWCLLLKALDPIEESNEDISYKLIPSIKSKWIIASFPTLTVSRKKMRNPRRNWFEKVLKRLELPYNIAELGDELFYIIKNEF